MNRQQEYQELLLELENTPDDMTQMSDRTKSRARKRNIIRCTLMPPGVFMAALLFIMVAVNVSPIMAYAFERIPVLRQIAAAVNFSTSLRDAIEHDFVQHIGQEQTIEGITMRVEYVIVDQRQLNIFYTLDAPAHSYFNSWAGIFCAEEGTHASATITSSSGAEAGEIRQVVVNFLDEQMPDQLILEMRVSVLEALYMEVAIPAPIQAPTEWVHTEPEIAATFVFTLEFDPTFTEQGETIYVNQEFVIDGQRLTLTTVEIYPTHMRANFSADPGNTAWLIALHFYAENERGGRFDSITNGISAFGTYGSPMMESHILHSPFFAESEHLTLFIEEVVWLDKDMEQTRIDLTGGTAARLPEGVSLDEARWDGASWHLSFAVIERAENHNHQVFGTRYFDEAGNEYWFYTWLSGMRFGETVEGFVPGVFFVQFTLVNYPYDIVYLSPSYSRLTRPSEPISLRVK